jgi:hypothetical protein
LLLQPARHQCQRPARLTSRIAKLASKLSLAWV